MRTGKRPCLIHDGFVWAAARLGHSEGRRVEYDLDPAGNRTVVRVDGRGPLPDGRRADRSTNRYTATPSDRRTYDANGNLLTVTDERGHGGRCATTTATGWSNTATKRPER